MVSTSPSDPDCQKSFIIIKDAAFSLVSCDRWHHVISVFELWGFLRRTSVVIASQLLWNPVALMLFVVSGRSCDPAAGFRLVDHLIDRLILQMWTGVLFFQKQKRNQIKWADVSIHRRRIMTSDGWRSGLEDGGQVITGWPDSCWRTVCVQIYSVNIYIYRYILYMRRCVLPWRQSWSVATATPLLVFFF